MLLFQLFGKFIINFYKKNSLISKNTLKLLKNFKTFQISNKNLNLLMKITKLTKKDQNFSKLP